MEHRGMPFTLVRTLAPTGWRWAVQLDDKQRSGEHVDRNVAIQQAKAVIDRLIERRRASGSSQTRDVHERGLAPKPAVDEI